MASGGEDSERGRWDFKPCTYTNILLHILNYFPKDFKIKIKVHLFIQILNAKVEKVEVFYL